MAIGLVMGRHAPTDPREAVSDVAQRVADGFRAQMGTALCPELTGFDMRTPESRKAFQESGVRDRVCAPAVKLASRLTVDILKDKV